MSPGRGRARFGAFEADFRSGELRKGGHKVRLRDQSFQVLALLLEHPGEVVSREELRAKLWPADTFVDFENGLNVAVGRLREALGDSAETPRFIETLPRRGYRFIAALEPSPEAQPAGMAARPSPARRWLRIAALGTALVLLALVFPAARSRARRLLGMDGPATIRSIAILPLENLSGDPAQEYFADGMTEALTTDLAQIGSLRVISRTSAMIYKGQKKPLSQMARELNVDAVVEGSVLRAGPRVRIDAQLVRASPEQHLWAKSYEGDLSDVLTLQSSVARGVATEIKAVLTPQDQARLSVARKVDPEAFETYLRGRHFWEQANGPDLRKSIEFYRIALAKDPNYALAYAGLADSYSMLSDFYLPPREVMPQAAEAAKKALELDDSLAPAHNALASIHFIYEWDWAGAEREFRRAIELNPNFADAHHLYGQYLAAMRRPAESAVEINRAEQLAPFSGQVFVSAGTAYWLSRQFDESIAHSRKGLSVDPQNAQLHIGLALALASKREFDEAIREGETARKLDESPLLNGMLGSVYAQAGRKTEARRVKETLEANMSRQYVCPYEVGTTTLLLGNKDEAFQWLDKAIEARSICVALMWTDPRLDSIRSDPRYLDLVHKLKFPE